MPPELLLAIGGATAAIVWGLSRLINAIIDRRVAKMKLDAEREKSLEDERRKMREDRRQRELEEVRAQAEQNAAILETMGNLVKVYTQLNDTQNTDRDTFVEKFHEQRQQLTMNTEAVGEMAESIDKVATAVADNNSAIRANTTKTAEIELTVIELQKTVNHINDRIMRIFPADEPMIEQVRIVLVNAVNEACERRKSDTGELKAINPPPASDSSEPGDGLKAAS